jgi:hypothetical protein
MTAPSIMDGVLRKAAQQAKRNAAREALENSAMPPAKWFFLELALYHKCELTDNDNHPLEVFISSSHQFDTYCPECEAESTFKCEGLSKGSAPSAPKTIHHDRDFGFHFSCARNNAHRIWFGFTVKADCIIKIMQYPSAADLSEGKVLKYKQVLAENANEFSKAIGLHAHGVGIGSFVYLRRIIERLVEEAHTEAQKEPSWNEVEYQTKLRVAEKIKYLGDRLPEFLTSNTMIYSILSKGIHSLTEKECNEAFEAVRLGIEVILDDKLAAKERAAKIKQASKGLSDLTGKHS